MSPTFTNAAAFIARATLAAVASTVVLSAAVHPAWAQDTAWQTRSAVVSTNGLNLNSQAGRAALQHRLAAAAHRVCAGEDSRALESNPAAMQACVDQAMAGTQRAVAAAQARGMVASAGTP